MSLTRYSYWQFGSLSSYHGEPMRAKAEDSSSTRKTLKVVFESFAEKFKTVLSELTERERLKVISKMQRDQKSNLNVIQSC